MGELVFIALIVFVAYVLFVYADKKETSDPDKTEEINTDTQVAEPNAAAVVSVAAEAVSSPEINLASKPAKPKATSAAKKTTAAKKTVTKTAPAPEPVVAETLTTNASTSDSIKNPATGEVAKIPNNYNFAKRWIKDALVAEGLLDKIYKNAELDDATNEKIHTALQKLKTLEKYQA